MADQTDTGRQCDPGTADSVTAPDPVITELRARIDELDRTILGLVNTRLELVHRIKERKIAAGIEFVDPDREAELLRDLVAANDGPLSDAGVEQLLKTILELGKKDVYER
jgi:chorismate mutase / prephenate dehydratase